MNNEFINRCRYEIDLANLPTEKESSVMTQLCATISELPPEKVPVISAMFHRLMSRGIITPLTGRENEWKRVDGVDYNIRCNNVIRDPESGRCVQADRYLFVLDGEPFQHPDISVVEVKSFPYLPVVETITPDDPRCKGRGIFKGVFRDLRAHLKETRNK